MESYEDKIKLHNDLQRFQIEKSIIGTEAYNIEQDLMKGISQEEILEKARSGIYKPTKQNLKEGKAGQKYGSEKKENMIKHTKESLIESGHLALGKHIVGVGQSNQIKKIDDKYAYIVSAIGRPKNGVHANYQFKVPISKLEPFDTEYGPKSVKYLGSKLKPIG